jgi:hypothetical protein
MKKILLTIALVFTVIGSYAQSLEFLNISSDPYSYSMGGNTLTLDANSFTVTNNASAMAYAEDNMYAAVSYMAWQPEILNNNVMGLSGFYRLGKLAVGVSGKYYTHTPYDITDNTGFISESYTPTELSAEVAAAYKLFLGLSVGANVRYTVSSMIKDKDASAISADISVSYKLKGLMASVAVTNIGAKIDYGYGPYNLPAMAKAGVGYKYGIDEKSSLLVSAEADYLIYSGGIMAGVGAEYNYNKMVSARVGYHYGDGKAIPSYASAGLGLNILGISLNAAYILGFSNSPVNGSYIISLGYDF